MELYLIVLVRMHVWLTAWPTESLSSRRLKHLNLRGCTCRPEYSIQLSRKYHPDVNALAEMHTTFIVASEVYAVLGDDRARHVLLRSILFYFRRNVFLLLS
jgi:hypothetical protein